MRPGFGLSSSLLLFALVILSSASGQHKDAPGLQPTKSTFPARPITMPLHRRAVARKTAEEWGIWAKAHREKMQSKYGTGEVPAKDVEKREQGTNLWVALVFALC